MGNIFVDKNKSIVKAYYEKAWQIKDKMAENSKTFVPDVAYAENKKLAEQNLEAYNKAVADIASEFANVRELLARANVIDTAEVPKEIEKVFSSNLYNLSTAEVQAYADEYKDNDTVTRIISDWIADKSQIKDGKLFGKYEGVRIVRPVDKLDVYKKFAESALYIIEQIHNDGTLMQRDTLTNERVEPLEINGYADEDFGKELFAVIGDGKALADEHRKHVPESLLHTFDHVQIERQLNVHAGIA